MENGIKKSKLKKMGEKELDGEREIERLTIRKWQDVKESKQVIKEVRGAKRKKVRKEDKK